MAKVKLKGGTVRAVADAIEGLLNAVGEQQALINDLMDEIDPDEAADRLDEMRDTTDSYLLMGQELVHELRRRIP